MRVLLSLTAFCLLAGCQSPPAGNTPEPTAPEAAAEPTAPTGTEIELIVNTDPKIPILTAFASGTLQVMDGCLVFSTREANYTPVWPSGTHWDAAAKAVITPAGGRFEIDKSLVLPGGPMGSAVGSDLKPSSKPVQTCPQDFFGVHPN